jgi:thiamine kinase-like enzyme
VKSPKIDKKPRTTVVSKFHLFFNYQGNHLVCDTTQLKGGLTNQSYLVRTTSNEYVARIPGDGFGQKLDRATESANTLIAHQAGITAEVVYDEKNGKRISRYLKNPQVLSEELLQHAHYIAQAATLLRKLHTSDTLFVNSVNIFNTIKELIFDLQKNGVDLPNQYLEVAEQMNDIEVKIQSFNIPPAPCHIDSNHRNFILSENEMYLIDFEYSGNNDPVWDLACFSLNADFTEDQDDILLKAYYDDRINSNDLERFHLFKPVVEFWICLWCQTQLNTLCDAENVSEIKEIETKHFPNCLTLLRNLTTPINQAKLGATSGSVSFHR